MRAFIAVRAAGKQTRRKIFLLEVNVTNVDLRDLKTADAISEARSAHMPPQHFKKKGALKYIYNLKKMETVGKRILSPTFQRPKISPEITHTAKR